MRHRKRNNIIIELTPLLDVIMIMIFIIMTNNGTKVAEADTRTMEAEEKITKITSDYESQISEKEEEILKLLASIEEKDGALDTLSEDLELANAKLNESDRIELRKQLAEISGKYDSLKYVEQYVTVINVNLQPVEGTRGKGSSRLIDTLTYSYTGSADSGFTMHEIIFDITAPDANDHNNHAVISDMTKYINTCIQNHNLSSIDGDTSLYIVFTYPNGDVCKESRALVADALNRILDANIEKNVYLKTNVINGGE